MATNGWIGEQTVHSWGSYNSRLTTNVYINGIRRYSDHIDVSGVIYLFCKSSGARTVWYDWAITAWCGGRNLGLIKPRTYNNNILGKSWSKNFSIRINCSNSATSATFKVGFSDSNMGGKDKYWTLYFNRYATSPSGITSVAGYTQYSTISTSCSGINWGQGYSSRKLTCTASYTYNGKTENFTLGTWTDGATSKSVTKTDFNFPADLNVTVKWTASTNIGSTSSTTQIRVKQTFPAPNLSNTTFTAESTAPYCIRVNVSGVDFGDNYSARKLELYGTYELDGIIYDNKLGEISNQTSWTLEYDASQEAEPWTKIPDDSSILLRLVADNGNRTSDKTIIINCQSSYEAYVIEHISEEEKEKSETYTGKNIQIQNAPKDAPLADFKLDGETSQQTYSGIQMLTKQGYATPTSDTSYWNITSGMSNTDLGDGWSRWTHTGNATWVNLFSKMTAALHSGAYKANTIYTILFEWKNATNLTSINLSQSNNGINAFDGADVNVNFSGASSGVYKVALTTKSAITNDMCALRTFLTKTTAASNATIDIRMTVAEGNYSSSNLEWQPYVGGVLAPNPNYPQIINTVTGENVVRLYGKNLLKPYDQSGTISVSGLTTTLHNNGSISINGTSTTETYIEFGYQFYGATSRQSVPLYPLNLSLEYNLSSTYTGTITGGAYPPRLYAQYNSEFQEVSAPFGSSVNISSSDGIYRSWMRIRSGTSFDNVTFYPQLELGSTTTTYEPYQGQNYEVNLGKNLYDKNNADYNVYLGSESVAVNAQGNGWSIAIPVEVGQTYTFSKQFTTGQASDSNYAFIGSAPAAGVVYIGGRQSLGTGTTFTATAPTGAKYLIVYYTWNATSTQKTDAKATFQIEKGSQASSYAPYFEPIELCKIGDYQDYIYKDGSNWKIHKACDKYVFDSSVLSWSTGTGTGGWVQGYTSTSPFYGKLAVGNASSYQSFCSHFEFQRNSTTWTGDGKCGFNTGGAFWCINSAKTTKQDFLDWLGVVNPAVYYPLATSAQTDTTITNEALIAQLETLLSTARTYAGVNNIFTITPNEQGTLEIQYYTKWQNTSPAILSANGRNGTGNFKQVRRIGTK